MAIARPVRALGLAAILMWCYFLYTVLRPAPEGISSAADFRGTIDRDPQLDRNHDPPELCLMMPEAVFEAVS